jgi:hypothetical protein
MRFTFTILATLLTACGAPADFTDAGLVGVVGVVDGGAEDAGLRPATPTTRDGLIALAQSGAHLGWNAEPSAHSSAGPHGGTVRTYVNPALYASLKAGSATHPNGSIAVKELFTAGAHSGWAIDAKGDDGVWTYLEAFEPALNQYFFRGSGNLCSGCHQGGVDQVWVFAGAFP